MYHLVCRMPPSRNQCFNPRPSFTPGDTWPVCAATNQPYSFNPRPSFTPGDTVALTATARYLRKFQSAPEFYPGRYLTSGTLGPQTGGFNPRPSFTPDDTFSIPGTTRIRTRFNPRPSFTPGDTGRAPKPLTSSVVSIRARVLPRAILQLSGHPMSHSQFQSAPEFYPGRYVDRGRHSAPARSFNPRPSFTPGDTSECSNTSGRQLRVSIRARVLPRAIRLCWIQKAILCFRFNPRPSFTRGDTGGQCRT